VRGNNMAQLKLDEILNAIKNKRPNWEHKREYNRYNSRINIHMYEVFHAQLGKTGVKVDLMEKRVKKSFNSDPRYILEVFYGKEEAARFEGEEVKKLYDRIDKNYWKKHRTQQQKELAKKRKKRSSLASKIRKALS